MTDLIRVKAAVVVVFILTIGQMIMCNAKWVDRSEKSTENYHPTL